ncbi:MAG: putative lipid II flippase FtsW [Comamonas sp.]|jgi:cell division protein FtsW|uniref:putative lipid II flippase FtsW n=1 Tax=Comamonas sp. TaxID=34028 RepID=UPI000FAF265E|nr:putative lipid II flippase FtsW [uncultured Comamonas sp.]MBP7645535.1 putative lipid II flippase FtsW [Comamonas sp.]MBP8186900.1 putative lipid II flippase FtsW [Comamonas sp.]MBP9940121.1 putative lipid II flippase FtsW [Comamonas sp.]
MNTLTHVRDRLQGWFRGAADKPVDVLPVRVGGTEYRNTRALPPTALGLDQALIWVVIALLAWGLVMVYSASIAMPDNPRFGKIQPYHFLLRHAMALGVGFVAALLAFQVSMKTWERLAIPMFLLALFLLVMVLVPGVGLVVNGARRWLPLGIMNFQPSELAKFAVLVYAADYMVRRMDVKERFFRAVLPMAAAVFFVGVLLLAEPDMGAFMVIVVISMGILFLGGVNARMFFLMAALVVGAFVMMIAFSPWRRERIFAYLDPFSVDHALGKGYQLSHALIAIGRGELFGVGLGRSVEKLHWLPEAHTDFLLSVIGEEFGFVGILILIIAFVWIARRITEIGREAIALDRVFSGLVAQGVALWFGFQAFINMGVNLGALPTKGLTLPLMSFGGSAILMNLIAIAVVLRIDYENKLLSPRMRKS